jgi:dipeptidyl aminopeptidase/acylaminoacyl peptidase
MTSPRRFEQDLPALLADLYLAGTPDYRYDLVQQVARVRQRPAWTFPGRWIPMEIVTSRAPVTRLPWRQLGVLALIAILLGALVAVYIGTRPQRLPPPFGIADNGGIAYSSDGDIYTIDPATGTVAEIVTGPDGDSDPAFSPDGTRVAFVRTITGASNPTSDLVVARADGLDPRRITASPIDGGPSFMAWASDSRSLLVGAPDNSTIWLFDATKAAEPRVVATDAEGYLQPFRPPDGSAILIRRTTVHGKALVRLDLDTLRETILAEGSSADDLGAARWSPDGTEVVYNSSPAVDPVSQRLFIVNADGTGTQQVTWSPGTWFDLDGTWSPDGTRIAFTRYERVSPGDTWEVRPIGIYSVGTSSVIAVGPLPREARAKDSNPGDSTASQGEGFDFEWSPDGTLLIAIAGEGTTHPVVINARDGSWRNLAPVIQPASTKQSWQRVAR